MARKKKKPNEHEVRREEIRDAMKLRHVRKFIWAILEQCGIYSPKYAPATGGVEYLVGRESIGLEIIAMLEDADPTIYPQLLLANIVTDKEETEDGTDTGTTDYND